MNPDTGSNTTDFLVGLQPTAPGQHNVHPQQQQQQHLPQHQQTYPGSMDNSNNTRMSFNNGSYSMVPPQPLSSSSQYGVRSNFSGGDNDGNVQSMDGQNGIGGGGGGGSSYSANITQPSPYPIPTGNGGQSISPSGKQYFWDSFHFKHFFSQV